MDAIVGSLVGAAQALTSRRLVVCALGGYGRRTLCLHSDVDLLIVFDGEIARDEERFVNAVLQPLWDLQLVVGHHVRELAELDTPDPENTEFMMALLDARPIAGDASALRARPRTDGRSARNPAPTLWTRLLGLVEQRHAQFNDTLYQLEPDIKNAPGGLRDIAASPYLRALEPGAFDVESAGQSSRCREAEEFLLRVRSVLHVESGRDVNVLTHELQERVADALGFEGARPSAVASKR